MSNVLVSRTVRTEQPVGDGEDGCPVEDSGAGTLDTGQHTGPVHSLGGDSLQHTQLALLTILTYHTSSENGVGVSKASDPALHFAE